MVDQLSELFPADRRLGELLSRLRPLLLIEDSRVVDLVRTVRMHLSETYRLHRRLIRNRRCQDLESLLPGRKKLVSAPWEDCGIGRAEAMLDQWRSRAAASVWGQETSEDAHGLAKIFSVLLESLWSEPLAFMHFVQVRQNKKHSSPPKNFGRLLDEGRLSLLTSAPTFEGEGECLEDLADLGDLLKTTRVAFLEFAEKFTLQLLKQDLRVVCMSTCPSIADDLYQRLAIRYSDFVTRHSSIDGAWRDRWDRGGAQVIVCDASAEDGVNLQGGKACMLHLDLPLSPNRLEQRVGRLDRFGVGKSVSSWAVLPEDASYLQAWSGCLSSAWQVFSRSIAALQYVVDEEMSSLEERIFLNGVDAINEATQRLSSESGIEREFHSIRNQDELDAIEMASTGISAKIAEGIERYEHDALSFQTDLERWLIEGLHFVRESVGKLSSYHFARPDRGRQTLMPLSALKHWFGKAFISDADLTRLDSPLSLATQTMAFDRETARSSFVGLARIGNPVIDGLGQHLSWDDRGTSFAMWRHVGGSDAGVFFRLDFIIETDLSELTAGISGRHCAMQRQADAAFPPITETLWLCRELGEPTPHILALLERPYGALEDANISAERWPLVLKQIECDDWSGLCTSVREVAERLLLARHELGDLTEKCALEFEVQSAVRQDQLRSRLETVPSTRSSEQEQLQRELEESLRLTKLMATGIRQPVVRLDAAGVVILSQLQLEDIGT